MTLQQSLQLKSLALSIQNRENLSDYDKEFIRYLLSVASKTESYDIVMELVTALYQRAK